jgi:hypothetical protein
MTTCTGDPMTCDCNRCQYENALDTYGERLAEAGSSAFMLYGDSGDAMSVAYQTVRKPRPEDFGLTADDVRPATPPPPVSPVDPTDLPF